MTMEEFLAEKRKEEEERVKILEEQIRKGCDKCSQWDSYWGCTKCESLF